ncbi:MAG: hypothetical protein P4M12_09915 [Gammaproteobacteria bacterium]|nr:hypothetical protein [Gammaproteobacteria bacterium]
MQKLKHFAFRSNIKVIILVFVVLNAISFSYEAWANKHHTHAKKTTAVVTHTEKTTEVVTHTADATDVTKKKRIVELVHKTIDNLNYSAYKMGGTKFDISKGVYIVDCSSFVDHLLERVNPHAYSSLVNSSGSDTPNTRNYYNFINGLADGHSHYWNKIEGVGELQAGDILVFRKKNSESAPGHIMVVMNKPVRHPGSFVVQVADSAPVGHSHDTRSRHVSGIGIGTLSLKVNPRTGHPFAYAWREGSFWKNNVHFAMARPIDRLHDKK